LCLSPLDYTFSIELNASFLKQIRGHLLAQVMILKLEALAGV
jgi:hypothetical protein